MSNAPRKGIAYAAEPGTGPKDQTCGTCNYLWVQRYRSRKVFKCLLQVEQWTHGAATDIRKSSPACVKWYPKPNDDSVEGGN